MSGDTKVEWLDPLDVATGFEVMEAGPRRVDRKKVAKQRAKNKAARKARKRR